MPALVKVKTSIKLTTMSDCDALGGVFTRGSGIQASLVHLHG